MTAIELIAADSPRLAEVIQLWRSNRNILGPYPAGAFEERAQNGQILAAIAGDSVLGYVLFFPNRQKRLIRLSHLCVDAASRGKGIAKQLIQALRDQTLSYHAITLHCRRDFAAWEIWQQLGFYAAGEKIGRGKDQHKLTYYRLDHEHKHLFSSHQDEDESLKVVIDANIFFDLDDPTRNGADETQGMIADWIQPLIQLCIDRELLNEIARIDDDRQRSDRLSKARQFDCLEGNADDYDAALDDVRTLLGTACSERDESDQRHLARTIASDATVFVTRDEPVLKFADEIYDSHGLSVVRPSQLIARFEELRNESSYQRARLAGSPLQISRWTSNAESLADQFQSSAGGERKRDLVELLRRTFAHPDRFECYVAQEASGTPLAIFVAERASNVEVSVPLFRLSNSVLKKRLASTLARTLLSNLIQKSLEGDTSLVRVTDSHLSNTVITALHSVGFFKAGDSWTKLSVRGTDTAMRHSARLVDMAKSAGLDQSELAPILDALSCVSTDDDAEAVLEIEHMLWPGKLVGFGIKNYIVSIRPRWASDLFDAGLASDSLFGAETELALNPDSVYYRKASRSIKTDEGRILWYVSDDDRFRGSMRIRASSQMRDVAIGKPKDIFRRFRRFGVYEWHHVLETAGSVDGKLMAVEFSDTELLQNPIHWDDVQTVLKSYDIKSQLLSPTEIPEEAFLELYRRGIGIDS
jgi:GNAT superfamily N-acetyltransferase/predicted nucleic acid-binding protein